MGGASIIGIVNQKGGTGKTTSCVNLGVDLAHEGKRVLLVDCDPQGSLTISLGYPQPDMLPVTLADQMTAVLNDSPIDPGGILHHDEGVDLLPANISLAGMEVSLVNAMSRETTLKRVLANYSKDYDHINQHCIEMQGCDISWTTRGKNGGICLHRLSFVVQPGRFHPTSSAVFRIVFPTRRNSFILGPHFSSSRKSTSSRSYYPTTRGAFLQRPFSAECFMTP